MLCHSLPALGAPPVCEWLFIVRCNFAYIQALRTNDNNAGIQATGKTSPTSRKHPSIATGGTSGFLPLQAVLSSALSTGDIRQKYMTFVGSASSGQIPRARDLAGQKPGRIYGQVEAGKFRDGLWKQFSSSSSSRQIISPIKLESLRECWPGLRGRGKLVGETISANLLISCLILRTIEVLLEARARELNRKRSEAHSIEGFWLEESICQQGIRAELSGRSNKFGAWLSFGQLM